ncbi:MAG: Ig-like domain-containing protein [Clostridium sp.]|nr:Ig-like domain-containing protein [Clostridium sp.]MCM1399102.1 Ig-like domain-containing protein [Clostridium sp.]MCM1459494.1 Ig-like domain-containing protein [Bacteroides sp.]
MKRLFFYKNNKMRILAFALAVLMMMTPFFAHAGLKKDSQAADSNEEATIEDLDVDLDAETEVENLQINPIWKVCDADGNLMDVDEGQFYKEAVVSTSDGDSTSVNNGILVYGYKDKDGEFQALGDSKTISTSGEYTPAIAYYTKDAEGQPVEKIKLWVGEKTIKIDADAPQVDTYVLNEIDKGDMAGKPDKDGNIGTIYVNPKGTDKKFKLQIWGSDGAGSGLKKITFDGTELTSDNSTFLTGEIQPSADAIHTIILEDNVGNQRSVTFTLIEDATNPVISNDKAATLDADGREQSIIDTVSKATSVTISAEVTEDNIKDVILSLETDEGTTEYKWSEGNLVNDNNQYSFEITNIETGDYAFWFKAEDKAGNKAESNKKNFYIINTPPTLSNFELQYKGKNGRWQKANFNEAENKYVLNPVGNLEYRLYVTAAAGVKTHGNTVTVKLESSEFTKLNNTDNYILNLENYTTDNLKGLSGKTIQAEDKFGNEGTTAIPEITVANTDVTVITNKFGWDGEVKTDLNDIPAYINSRHEFTVYVQSFYDIDAENTVLTNGTDTISCKPIEKARITYDEATGIIETPVTFVIGDMSVSTLFKDYKLKVCDTRGNSNENFALKEILLDLERPYLKETEVTDQDGTVITDFSRWYQSATLAYTVSGGDNLDATLKSPLEAVAYVISNAGTSNGTNQVDVTEGVTEISGELTVPESDASAGTVITFAAEDKAGNSIQTANRSNVVTVKVDQTEPEIAGVKVNETVISKADGTPDECTIVPVRRQTPIEVTVRDNLAIESIRISLKDPQGNAVTLGNSFRQFSADEALKQGNTVLQETLKAGLDVSGLAEGKYTLTVKVVDKAGNEKEISGYEFIINTKTPVILDKATGKAPVSDKSWHNEASFKKTFAVSLSSAEGRLKTITYTIEDSRGNIREKNIISNGMICNEQGNPTFRPASGTMEFDVDIPEAARASGTKLTIHVVDMGENEATSTVNYLYDKINPYTDDLTIDGSDTFTAPIATKNPEIAVRVGDTLTLETVNISVRGPKKTTAKSFDFKYNAAGTSGIERSFKKKLSDIIGNNIPDGRYTVVVSVKDKAGNTSENERISFDIDRTKPVVTVKAASGTASKKTKNPYYYNTDVGIELTYTEVNLDKVTVTDNGTPVQNLDWKAVTGTDGKYRARLTVGTEGIHKLAIVAVDKTGNTSSTKQITFVVDKTVPDITAAVNGTTYTDSMGQLMLTGTAAVAMTVRDANIDTADNYVQVIKKIPDKEELTTKYAKTSNLNMSFDEEAEYTVNFYAVDMANNKSTARTVGFRVDKEAPNLSISGAVGSGTSSSAAVVTFTMREAFWWDAGGTVSIYRKAGDANAEELYKTIELKPAAYETSVSETLTETGVYRFEVEASDRVGHTANVSQTFTIDRDAPVITLNGVNDYDKTSTNVEFTAQITDEFYTSKKVTITGTRTDETGKVNDISFSGYSQGANPTVISENFTDDGIYDVTIVSSDAAGNEQRSQVHFTIDKSAPVIGDLSSYDGKVLTGFSWDIDLDDIVSDLTVCDVHMYLNGSEYDGVSEIEDGSYVLRVVATDELGHTTEKEVSFELDTKAPVFIVTGVEKDEVKDEPYTIEVSLQLSEDMLSEVILNGKQMNISENVCRFDVTEKGDYTLELKAVDHAGNEAADTIAFRYGQEKTMWWLWIILLLAIILLTVIIIIIAKRRKDNR